MSETGDRVKTVRERIGMLSRDSPEMFAGFARLSKAATAAGNMTSAQKELIAVAIAITQGCDDCILYHVDAAVKHGAERTDLIEVVNVAVEMGGGPAVMYATKALQAFEALQ